MSLIYPSDWKFKGSGISIPIPVMNELHSILLQIDTGNQSVIEDFKSAFGNGSTSTSYGWAVTDLENQMLSRIDNAPLFIDNYWQCIERAQKRGLMVPTYEIINGILAQNKVPYAIDLPNLRSTSDAAVIIDDRGSLATGNEKVPAYVLKDQIGQGGYGTVYKASRTTNVDEFMYALKILDPSPFVNDYDKAILRFRREVAAIRSLQHRAIVQYFEAGLTIDNKPYIVMQLIEGLDLRSAVASSDISKSIKLFVEILHALHYAHHKDVIHRDLKPSNIIVRSSDGQPIILDFGSSYLLNQMDTRTLTTQAVGSLGYIPSEVISDPSCRSPLQDIYACGIMLYEAFIGKKPDPANYNPISGIRPELSLLDPIIKDAISGATNRISTALEFSERLIASHDEMFRNNLPGNTYSSLAADNRIDNLQNISFDDEERYTYRSFIDSVHRCVSKVRSDASICSSPETIFQKLTEAYQKVQLEDTVPDPKIIIRCFIDGSYYFRNGEISVIDLRNFINMLKTSSIEKQLLIIENCSTRLSSIKLYTETQYDDLPF